MAATIELPVGPAAWSVTVPPDKAVELRRAPVEPPAGSAGELVRAALENPHGFEAMRRALTPDDRVTVVLDAHLPHAAELLGGVLEHLVSGGIAPAAVTVVTPPGSPQGWIDELGDEFADITAETHDPADRKKLAYLATTNGGRRVYLNRSVVEADFVVLLTGRGFDPVRGHAGAEVGVYPDLSDDETRTAHAGPFTKESPWAGRGEAQEVAWLLGTPFLVQVIEGTGGTVQEVVAGLLDTNAEGVRRQNARWKATVEEQPDVVIATVPGPAERITFADLARAARIATKVTRKGGRVVLLTAASPPLGDGAEMLRQFDDARDAGRAVRKAKSADWAACVQWCAAAAGTRVCLASGYPDDLVEELFATPIRTAAEVQRLIDAGDRVLVIPDAHKMKITVE